MDSIAFFVITSYSIHYTKLYEELILDQCYTDIESSMLKIARKLGVEVSDLTNTEYFAFLLDMLQKDIPKMIFIV